MRASLRKALSVRMNSIARPALAARATAQPNVEQPDAEGTERPAHRCGEADIGQGSGEEDPVETGPHAADLAAVPFDKRVHPAPFAVRKSTDNDRPSDLFGSGSAGLGYLGSYPKTTIILLC